MADDRQVPLHDLHESLGGRMVPFAGWTMPVQFEGVMPEHNWTRENAGLFDVSHMGQVILRGESADAALERLVCADIVGLKEGRQRYALFTDDDGGILDDLMVARKADHLFLVVNAARADHDIAHLKGGLGQDVTVEVVEERALLALQGPKAETALARLVPGAAKMKFMDASDFDWEGADLWVTRSGYTGEDGYEVSLPVDRARDFAETLLEMDEVKPIGLGARDSLRLEAGLCLYGQDIDETTSIVEAALEWAVQKARKPGGTREGGFPGADRFARELADGAPRRRVGLLPEGRAPMRGGTTLHAGDRQTGHVTSGGFGPTLGRPVAMGYVATEDAATGTELTGEVRGKRLPVSVADMPFRPATYKR